VPPFLLVLIEFLALGTLGPFFVAANAAEGFLALPPFSLRAVMRTMFFFTSPHNMKVKKKNDFEMTRFSE
jgi:hypothetical protein